MDSEIPWTIINKYFEDNPNVLVGHNLSSYNDFMNKGIKQIFKEKNPIVLQKEQDPKTNEFQYRVELYLGGKNGDLIYYGKPVIYDDDPNSLDKRAHFMYPNEARLRNMTYGTTIHYDVDVEFIMRDSENNITNQSIKLDKRFLGRFPIMLQSDLCILHGLNPAVRFNMGECKNDYGGYFIIDGKEKVIISQEKFADNMLYIREYNDENDIYSHSADIRTVSEDASKPERTMSVKIVAPSSKYTNQQIVVNIPNVRKPIPLFIVMRALGVISDKEIIEYCLLDLEKNKEMIDLFIPSIHDANKIFTQDIAIQFIATFLKTKTASNVHNILSNYFLPQVGDLNYIDKAYYLGYIVNRLLRVFQKIDAPTDTDNFKFKRVDPPGKLLYDLFKEYYALQQVNIRLKMDTEYFMKDPLYKKDFNSFISLIELNVDKFFEDRIVEAGFRKAFKGDWGSIENTKKEGIVQDLNRLSYNSFLSSLRKINLPIDSSAKTVKPRILHGSQWGIIDPVDTPDGANCGLHKHMAITTTLTTGFSGYPITRWLRSNVGLKLLQECPRNYLYETTKVFVNGNWVGNVSDPERIELEIKTYRRFGCISPFISVHWENQKNEILIYTDSGRLCRPIFYYDALDNHFTFERKEIISKLEKGNFKWKDLIIGFNDKNVIDYKLDSSKIYEPTELYGVRDIKELFKTKIPGALEYIDAAEEESSYITFSFGPRDKKYTHVEIHPSLLFGIMGNQIAFPENNQLPRNVFACGQAKQAISLYSTNYLSRIDKMGVILNYGQVPLIKSRYLKYINNEEHPCGENLIVAIMCYSGYNVEDSILFNEGSIKRGMFRTTYYNMYESREETSKVKGTVIDSHFANIQNEENISNLKAGYDYSKLDKHGIIQENTQLDDKIVLIGKIITNLENIQRPKDASVFPKKGQLGFVDKSFITESEQGTRLAKVRIREERMPSIGDKFCSRCGQKGTCGLVIPEQDMPFTEDGIRPDIIINPHAIPSRMTIGQLIETLMGKACAIYGGYGDCTAFMNIGDKHKMFGDMLTNMDFHSSGNQILYNGMNGEQIQSEIFIGPTYYMRLKHMVKDKINYRARGPRTLLTRQTVQGRANDGGLRIGEMERDGLIAHGISHFLEESLMVRGDEYYMAICNKTGTIAIYNEALDLYMSPMADGPIQFTGNLENNMNIINKTKYGRSFSIVRVPYAFKLLMQELQTMNVSMRIITSDNVDQIGSMNYSVNINDLLQDRSITVDKVIEKNKVSNVTASVKTEAESIRNTELQKPQNKDASVKLEYEQEIINNIRNTEMLGWKYAGNKNDAPVFISLILDKNGAPTEIWNYNKENLQFPKNYPNGWIFESLYYSDGKEIQPELMVETLAQNQVPNNWTISLVRLYEDYDKKLASQVQQQLLPLSPVGYISPPEYTATSPVQGIPQQQQGVAVITPTGQVISQPGSSGSPIYMPVSMPITPEYTATSPVEKEEKKEINVLKVEEEKKEGEDENKGETKTITVS